MQGTITMYVQGPWTTKIIHIGTIINQENKTGTRIIYSN